MPVIQGGGIGYDAGKAMREAAQGLSQSMQNLALLRQEEQKHQLKVMESAKDLLLFTQQASGLPMQMFLGSEMAKIPLQNYILAYSAASGRQMKADEAIELSNRIIEWSTHPENYTENTFTEFFLSRAGSIEPIKQLEKDTGVAIVPDKITWPPHKDIPRPPVKEVKEGAPPPPAEEEIKPPPPPPPPAPPPNPPPPETVVQPEPVVYPETVVQPEPVVYPEPVIEPKPTVYPEPVLQQYPAPVPNPDVVGQPVIQPVPNPDVVGQPVVQPVPNRDVLGQRGTEPAWNWQDLLNRGLNALNSSDPAIRDVAQTIENVRRRYQPDVHTQMPTIPPANPPASGTAGALAAVQQQPQVQPQPAPAPTRMPVYGSAVAGAGAATDQYYQMLERARVAAQIAEAEAAQGGSPAAALNIAAQSLQQAEALSPTAQAAQVAQPQAQIATAAQAQARPQLQAQATPAPAAQAAPAQAAQATGQATKPPPGVSAEMWQKLQQSAPRVGTPEYQAMQQQNEAAVVQQEIVTAGKQMADDVLAYAKANKISVPKNLDTPEKVIDWAMQYKPTGEQTLLTKYFTSLNPKDSLGLQWDNILSGLEKGAKTYADAFGNVIEAIKPYSGWAGAAAGALSLWLLTKGKVPAPILQMMNKFKLPSAEGSEQYQQQFEQQLRANAMPAIASAGVSDVGRYAGFMGGQASTQGNGIVQTVGLPKSGTGWLTEEEKKTLSPSEQMTLNEYRNAYPYMRSWTLKEISDYLMTPQGSMLALPSIGVESPVPGKQAGQVAAETLAETQMGKTPPPPPSSTPPAGTTKPAAVTVTGPKNEQKTITVEDVKKAKTIGDVFAKPSAVKTEYTGPKAYEHNLEVMKDPIKVGNVLDKIRSYVGAPTKSFKAKSEAHNAAVTAGNWINTAWNTFTPEERLDVIKQYEERVKATTPEIGYFRYGQTWSEQKLTQTYYDVLRAQAATSAMEAEARMKEAQAQTTVAVEASKQAQVSAALNMLNSFFTQNLQTLQSIVQTGIQEGLSPDKVMEYIQPGTAWGSLFQSQQDVMNWILGVSGLSELFGNVGLSFEEVRKGFLGLGKGYTTKPAGEAETQTGETSKKLEETTNKILGGK